MVVPPSFPLPLRVRDHSGETETCTSGVDITHKYDHTFRTKNKTWHETSKTTGLPHHPHPSGF